MLILPPRSSWLYRMSISLSTTKRYLMTLLFMAIVVFIWFQYVYEPLNDRINTLQNETNNSEKVSPEEIAAQIAALRNELNTESSPRDDQMATVLGCIDQAGMVLENCSMHDTALYVQATGTYAESLAFFEHLASSTHPLLPRDVRLMRNADKHFILSMNIEI